MTDYYEILKLRPSNLSKLEESFKTYIHNIKNSKTPFSATRIKNLKKAIMSYYLLSDDKNRILYNRLFLDGNIHPNLLEQFARVELEYSFKSNKVIAALKEYKAEEGLEDSWMPLVAEGLDFVIA